MIADVDGNGVDDVVRWLPTGDTAGLWEVSYGGRTGWQQLGSISWPATSQSMHPAYSVHGYVGHFTGAPAADLLSVDLTRFSSILNRATASFSPYSLFAY